MVHRRYLNSDRVCTPAIETGRDNAGCDEERLDCGWEVAISCLIGPWGISVVSDETMYCEKSVFQPRAQGWTCSRKVGTLRFESDSERMFGCELQLRCE